MNTQMLNSSTTALSQGRMEIHCWGVWLTAAETVSTFPVLDFLTQHVCAQQLRLIIKQYSQVSLSHTSVLSISSAPISDKIALHTFPGQSLSRTDVSQTRPFPNQTFPGKTFPRQLY